MLKLPCAVLLFLASLPAAAQQKTEAPKPPDPPDRKAYTEATAVKDPEARIKALEKWLHDYPKSDRVEPARSAILDSLLKVTPPDEKRIRKAARKVSRHGNEASVANRLLQAGLLLNDAEKYAKAAVARENPRAQAKYIEMRRAAAQKRKRQPPSIEVLAKQFQTQRARPLTVLGRVYLKRGEVAQAEPLLKEAFAADPSAGDAAAGLAEIAEQRGDVNAALDLFVKARLAGHMPADTPARLEAVYRKTHNGSNSGLEELLDGRYANLYPNPIHTEPYKPGPKRSNRVVMVEVFTGAGCPPCVGADVAFDGVLERFTRDEVALIMNHQHIPRPDPLTNPATIARGNAISLRGVPTFLIDGKRTVGGGARDDAPELWDSIRKSVESELEKPAEAAIALDVARTGTSVTVHARVDGIREGAAGQFRLHLALVEEKLRYSGENGVRFHPMVVRAFAGPFKLDPAAKPAFDAKFDVSEIAAGIKAHLDDYEENNTRFGKIKFIEKKYEVDAAKLAVVAFIDDENGERILQSAYRKVM